MTHAQPPEKHSPADAGDVTLELVEQARNGDRQAFHRLVDRFQPEIYRMIYYRTRSKMDAEDLTQDVFLQAYNHLGRLKSPAVFRSWLYRIAVNRVRDYHRKKQFRSLFHFGSVDDENFLETETQAEQPDGAANMVRKEFWDRVSRAMERLSRLEKEVFMLRFMDELSIKEITTAMGKNESTVKTHLYRALSKVKADFAGMDELLEGIG